MDHSLFTYNHQLNYDEALRRLEYWTNVQDASPVQARNAIRTLLAVMKRDRDILYFEPKEVPCTSSSK